MRKPTRTTTVGDILAGHDPSIRSIAQELRRLVKNTIEATEKAYPGWRGIGYSHPEAGYFCVIFPLKDLVKLGFENGALMLDPFGILRAGPSLGNKIRYIEVASRRDIDEEKVAEMLHIAVDFKK